MAPRRRRTLDRRRRNKLIIHYLYDGAAGIDYADFETFIFVGHIRLQYRPTGAIKNFGRVFSSKIIAPIL